MLHIYGWSLEGVGKVKGRIEVNLKLFQFAFPFKAKTVPNFLSSSLIRMQLAAAFRSYLLVKFFHLTIQTILYIKIMVILSIFKNDKKK